MLCGFDVVQNTGLLEDDRTVFDFRAWLTTCPINASGIPLEVYRLRSESSHKLNIRTYLAEGVFGLEAYFI